MREKRYLRTITMSHLHAGDYFGENGILTGKKRFASGVYIYIYIYIIFDIHIYIYIY